MFDALIKKYQQLVNTFGAVKNYKSNKQNIAQDKNVYRTPTSPYTLNQERILNSQATSPLGGDKHQQILDFSSQKTIPIPPKEKEIYTQQIQPQIQQQQQINAPTQTNIKPEVSGFLENIAFPITRKYGIPDAIVAGMYAAEGRGSGLGAERNNFFNINAIDENPNLANYYDSPEEGVEAFAKLISERFADALKTGNVEDILYAIEQGNYAGDPSTYSQRANNGFYSYSDFIKSTPEYRGYL